MIRKMIFKSTQFSSRLAAFAAAIAVFLLISSSVSAAARCKEVHGRYVEHAVSENCTSPVGLCIAGEYSGNVKGMFSGAATALIPTADTPTTGVVMFTSDSVIHASVGGKSGDLTIKNAGAFHTVGAGEIVDLQYITGGTGDFSGATGAIRASGTFVNGSGQSEYEGMICLP